ncbi:hypothetical protein C7M84_008753 [Penaeus vannamei]|uniref:Gustatory receptor n=1 Tax=Penaeus vannamei TaxID=6689 RepID=A0A3R7QN73_PENVA|nr:hypothetical protein C7M84_008753 [Penaeus vannamei]
MQKRISVSDTDMSAKVGVEGAWPVLFRVMGILGFIVAKRRPSGHYETCWPRLIPMVAIMTSVSCYLFIFPHSLNTRNYDSFIHVSVAATSIGLAFNAFAVAVLKRRATCSLFQALDGTQRPPKAWVSILSSVLFAAYVVFCGFKNYLTMHLFTDSIPYLITTLPSPIVFSLLDFYLIALIDAIHKAHKGKVEQGHRRLRRPSGSFPPPSGNLYEVSYLMRVPSVMEHYEDLSGLVSLYNEVFSTWILLRCVTFLLKLATCSYFLVAIAKERAAFAIILSHFAEEVGRFGLLCRRADSLANASKALEDSLFALLQRPDTTPEDRIQLLSFLAHLKSRPAHIAVGSVGVLCSSLLVSLINVALTYAAILFQYQPSSDL